MKMSKAYDLRKLTPWEDNPKVHDERQIQMIRASLRRFGFAKPLVAQSGSKRLIAGHGTLQAALAEGIETGPVVFLEMTDEQAAEYAVADNKLAERSDWDEDILKGLLEDIKEPDWEALGFTDFDISELLAEPKEPEVPDDFPEYDESIKTEHQCPKCGYEWSGSSS